MRTINNSRGQQVRVPTYRISAPYDGTENPPVLMCAIEKIMADLRAQMTPQQEEKDPFLQAVEADHLFVEEVRRLPERFSLKNIVARVKEEVARINRHFLRIDYDFFDRKPAAFGFVFPRAQLSEGGQMTFKDEHNYPDIRRSLIPDCGGYTGSGFQMFRPNDSRMMFFVPISVLNMRPSMRYLQPDGEVALFYQAADKYMADVRAARARKRKDPVPGF